MKNSKSTYILVFTGWLISFILVSCFGQSQRNSQTDLNEKQKGIHVFGRIDSTSFEPLAKNNMNWITMVPWGYQADFDSPEVGHHRGDSAERQRRDSSWVSRIKMAQAAGFKVFLKPHIWIHDPSEGKWRSDIYPTNEENWELWKTSYIDFILRYAKIAEQTNSEMFCIGTELTRLSIEKSLFWETLIPKIKEVYSGKITYAANWYQEYENITFWDKMDYIGIQAYFPLSENENPTVKEISKGWDKHISKIGSLQKKFDKAVLFTEIGYKSTTDSATKPWEWMDYSDENNQKLSHQTQSNCYKAFFDTIWKLDWFAGVHIWQWRASNRRRGHYDSQTNLDFTPKGKPAEKIIAKGFE